MKKILFSIALLSVSVFLFADIDYNVRQFKLQEKNLTWRNVDEPNFDTYAECEAEAVSRITANDDNGKFRCNGRTIFTGDGVPASDPVPDPVPPNPDPIPNPPNPVGSYPGVPMPNWAYDAEPVNSRQFAGGNSITFNGTANNPDFVTVSGVVNNPITLRGSYGVLVGGEYRGLDGSLIYSGNHIAVRNATIVDADTGWGAAIYGGGSDFILMDSDVTAGNVNLNTDVDHHCWKLEGNRIWSIRNRFHDCQGDGIQVGDQNNAPGAIRDVFIVGNHAENNLQTGYWVKNATNVLIAYNTATKMNKGENSVPACGGGQYKLANVWFVQNTCTDSKVGFRIASTNSNSGRYFIDNDISLNTNAGSDSFGYGWGIQSWSSDYVYTYNNKAASMVGARASIQSCSDIIANQKNVSSNCTLIDLITSYENTFSVEAPF